MFQRAELALRLEPLIAEKAKVKQKESGEPVPQKSVKPPVDTQKEVARSAGVSHDTIHKVKAIAAKAPEPVKEQPRRGETTRLSCPEVLWGGLTDGETARMGSGAPVVPSTSAERKEKRARMKASGPKPTPAPINQPKLMTIDEVHAVMDLPVTPGVLRRWCHVGIKVGDQRIKLRHKWFGARMYTCPEWIDEFNETATKAREEHAATADARREAYRAARRNGRPPGRRRKEDPNVRQKRIDAAIERLRRI